MSDASLREETTDRRNASDRHPALLILLHWLTAVLVLAQFVLAGVNALFYEGYPIVAEFAVQAHLSLGFQTLAMVLLRLVAKIVLPKPIPLADGPILTFVKVSGQAGLYALLIVLPVTGYIKLASLGFPIAVFGVLPLPTLPIMPDVSAIARLAHTAAAITLVVAVSAHTFFALFHEKLFGTRVIQRMLP